MSKPSARKVALDVLTKVEKDRSYSNLQLNQSLQAAQLERVDAALATELVYGTIQRLNTLDWILEPYVKKGIEKLELWVRVMLRLSVYQVYYLDRIPDHAVVNEAVELAKAQGHRGVANLINGVLREVIRSKDARTIPEDVDWIKKISLQHSHPEWLVSRWEKTYGRQETEEMCKINNVAPLLSIRVNQLKMTTNRLIQVLEEDGFELEASSIVSEGILSHRGGNMANHPLYKDGMFSIQDESSMLVAKVLRAEPGMKVLDTCAAPGGKTTHIAELMNDEGEIIACDIHKHKTKLIDQQAKRLGVRSISSRQIDVRKLDEHNETFDRILVDAPCTGFGVIRRKPDLKWTKQRQDVENIANVQQSILHAVAPLLKVGGAMVYSTCTVDREENHDVIQAFLQSHPNFSIDHEAFSDLPEEVKRKSTEGMLQLLPHHFNSDGFFIARMIRIH